MILCVGAGRQTSSELRARIALDPDGVRRVLRAPRDGIRELVALSTCHRTELYIVAEGSDADALHTALALLPGLNANDQADLNVMRGSDAVRHLYRVACGLDSLVVGEPQILGQIRSALTLARQHRAAGPLLVTIFNRAITLGRDVRRATPLGKISSSLGALAAGHLAQRLGGLEGRRGAVVGAGDAAADAARALRKHGAQLVVVARSEEPAERLARSVGAEVRAMHAITQTLAESAFAVVAVNGGTLIDRSALPVRGPSAPLHIVDLSVPPSVDIGVRIDVDVRTIDDLSPPHDESLPAAVTAAGLFVEDAVALWERWVAERPAGRDVGRFRLHVEEMVRAEVVKELERSDLSPEEAERMSAVAMRIANKLLHAPSVAMREADEDTRREIMRAFGMEPR